ncbi:MAG: hypothetical protein ABJ313_12690 [Cyclobacteriaceae bacterium]
MKSRAKAIVLTILGMVAFYFIVLAQIRSAEAGKEVAVVNEMYQNKVNQLSQALEEVAQLRKELDSCKQTTSYNHN